MNDVILWAEDRWPGFSESLRSVGADARSSAIDDILNQDLEGVFELFNRIQSTLDSQPGLTLRDLVILDQLGINVFDQ